MRRAVRPSSAHLLSLPRSCVWLPWCICLTVFIFNMLLELLFSKCNWKGQRGPRGGRRTALSAAVTQGRHRPGPVNCHTGSSSPAQRTGHGLDQALCPCDPLPPAAAGVPGFLYLCHRLKLRVRQGVFKFLWTGPPVWFCFLIKCINTLAVSARE